jgi:hypothetical protein
MSIFETDSRLPFTGGILAILSAVAIAVAAGIGIFLLPLSGLTFFFLLAALAALITATWLAWQLYGYLNSSYAIDRNAFVIRWGVTREIIPMGDVQRVIAAGEIADGLKLRRVPLAGWWRGYGTHPALGQVVYYATDAPANQIVVITADRNFVVTPYDTEAFLDAFKARFEMQPTQPVVYSRVTPNLMEWQFWSDRAAHFLILAAFALNLGAFGIGLFRFPDVSGQVPLHFDARGIADRLVPRTQLFTPAYIALALLIVSIGLGFAFYWRKERLLAYLLWGGSMAIQALFAVAIITVGFSN